MKKLKSLFGKAYVPCLLAVAQLTIATSIGQTLSYYFVAPSGTITSLVGSSASVAGLPAGYGAFLITATNFARFTNSAPADLVRTYSALQSGTALRARINQVLQIDLGLTDVRLYLIDDRTGVSGDTVNFVSRPLAGSSTRFIWPAAVVRRNLTGQTNRYTGHIGLSATAARHIQTWPGAWAAWEQTIVHEHLHTVFVNEKTKWAYVNIVYGGDPAHFVSELLGEQELAFEEGLGTFFGAIVNQPHGVNAALGFFTRTDPRYMVESRSVLAGQASVWNAPHTETELPIPPNLPQTGRYLLRHYRWTDVPGYFIQFAENTSTAFHLYFWQHAYGNRDQALDMILNSARSMAFDRTKRYLTYAVNRLALQMESTAPTTAGNPRTSSMFPFALLDVLTHFGMTENEYREEYSRNYPDANPRAFTEYWRHRDAVRTLARPHLESNPIRMDQAVAAIHQYFVQPATVLIAP